MNWACALRVACGAGSLVLFACTGDTERGTARIFSAELRISEEAPGSWSRELPAGAYLFSARESDIDFRMTINVAGKSSTLADEIPRHGYQATVVTLHEPTLVRVALDNADYRDWKGSAALAIVRLRDADTAPDARELGFASFGEGGSRLARAIFAERELSTASFREAIRHFTAANDIAARADANYALAFTEYLLRMDNPAAVVASDQARADFEATRNAVGVHDAIALHAMSDIEIGYFMNAAQKRAERQQLFDAADERLRVAETFFDSRGLNLRRDYAFNVRGIGVLYSGDYEGAAPFFEEAIRRAYATGDTRERIKFLSNLAWTQNRLGQFEKAMPGHEEALRLSDFERESRQVAYLLTNYGLTAVAIGEFDTALAAQTRAHAFLVENGMRAEAAIALSSIAGIYLRIGDPERALGAYELAMAEFKVVKNFSGLASAGRMAGAASVALGRHEQALAYLRRAMEIEARPVEQGRTHILIARILRELGDLRGARRELAVAQAQARETGNALLRASALDELGRLRIARGESKRAIDDLRAADAGFAALGADIPRIETNTVLSNTWLARGDAAEAARVADVAIALENRIRVKSANPEWRASLLSMSYAPYEARIAAELAGNERDPDHVWHAFQIASRVRARAMEEELTASGTKFAEQTSNAEALRARLTAQLGRLESRLQRSGPDDPTAIELRRVAEVTRAEFAALRTAKASPTAALTLPESLAQLQTLLPHDLAVIAFFTGDRTTHAWLLTRVDFRHARAPGAAKLGAELDAFVAELRASPGSRPGAKLGAELLGGLLDGVSAKRLVIVPDGPLNGMPFAALPSPGASHDLLVDRFVISMSPSLALALRGAATPANPPARVAVVSDPVYSRTDRRLLGAAAEKTSTLRDSRSLSRLPYSAIEARSVLNAFAPDEAIDLSGFDATPARVLALQGVPLRVLHFATHARGADVPEDSALLLSRFGADGLPLTSSSLTADDIARSRLHADLVVLSGCATGEGRALRGGGVLGLTHGFLTNGSRSVIASLWPIEDAPAARFMEEFYAAYRLSGRAAEALRIAQLRTRSGPAKTVWSSFVVRANELP